MGTIHEAASWIMAYPGFQDPKCNQCGETEGNCDCCPDCGAPASFHCDCYDKRDAEQFSDDYIEDGVRTS